MPPSIERAIAFAIVVVYLVIGGLFALRTPAWQAPDEPAHYNYIAQMAAGQWLPVIQMGDWDNDYLDELKANRFAPDIAANIDTVRYENHQPPLYYAILVPVYALTNGDLTALRLVSVLMGALTVIVSYGIGHALFQQGHMALATMGLVAFLPQQVAIWASINNDALASLLIAVIIWALIRYLRPPANHAMVHTWQLGVLVGVVFITKTTAYFMAGVVVVAVIIRAWQRARQQPSPSQPVMMLREVAIVLLPMLPFALFWWGRNILVYGFPDFLGLRAHDAIVIGQPRTADLIAQVGWGDYLRSATQTTFNSFWGQFGWMAAPLPQSIYLIIQVVLAIVIMGAFIWLARRNWHTSHPSQALIWLMLWGIIGLTAAQFVFYNATFVQFQGRYLFTALIPLALIFTLGIEAWRRLLVGRFGASVYLTALAFTPLVLLDIYVIWRIIPGALSPEFL